jgi:hypothetical protein
MGRTIRALTVFAIVGVVLVFVHVPKRIAAQQWQGYSCATFDTDYLDCPSCCTQAGKSFSDMIVGVNRDTGIQDPYLAAYNCGDPVPGGCSVDCSGQYDEALDDPGCCGSNGVSCGSDQDCCSGLFCTGGMCSFCKINGDECYNDSECCSGICDPDFDMCVDCLSDYAPCQYDSQCCDYWCDDYCVP